MLKVNQCLIFSVVFLLFTGAFAQTKSTTSRKTKSSTPPPVPSKSTAKKTTTPKRSRTPPPVPAPAPSVPSNDEITIKENEPALVIPAVAYKKPIVHKTQKFFYTNLFFTSFADQAYVKSNGSKFKVRSIFSGGAIGFDYTLYTWRYLYGWNMNFLTGNVDTESKNGISYPRKSFIGVHTGPEIGYRFNSDMDWSVSLGLLYRDIKDLGGSLAFSNQLNIKFRLTPKLTFFQNFGNYGTPTAYSYSIGVRWLL